MVIVVTMSHDGLHTPPRNESAVTATEERKAALFNKLIPVLMPTYDAVSRGLDRMGIAMADSFTGLKKAVFTPSYDQESVNIAVRKLKHTREFLNEKIMELRERTAVYEATARLECESNNKQGALHQLRLKNMYGREAAKMETLRFNIESNILHMESVGVMMETVATIRETSAQFRMMSAHTDFDKLESSIEEMFEQSDTSTTIENILKDMHSGFEIDDEAVMQELESMLGPDAGRRDNFPTVPVFTPVTTRQPEKQVQKNELAGVLTTI